MDLLHQRNKTPGNDLLEKRFIAHILKEEANQLDQNQIKLMSTRGFSSSKFINHRGFQVVDDNKLQYTHNKILRFVDMPTRANASGTKIKKKAHPVHNKPLFGMISNLLRRLRFEYTDKMKKMLSDNTPSKF